MTEVIELPVFDEAAELFGAPPIDTASHRIDGIFGMLVEQNEVATPLEILMTAGLCAAEMQGDAYTEVLDAVVNAAGEIGVTDHAQLKDLFHRAARYGEARMLSSMIADLFACFAARIETAGHLKN